MTSIYPYPVQVSFPLPVAQRWGVGVAVSASLPVSKANFETLPGSNHLWGPLGGLLRLLTHRKVGLTWGYPKPTHSTWVDGRTYSLTHDPKGVSEWVSPDPGVTLDVQLIREEEG